MRGFQQKDTVPEYLSYTKGNQMTTQLHHGTQIVEAHVETSCEHQRKQQIVLIGHT